MTTLTTPEAVTALQTPGSTRPAVWHKLVKDLFAGGFIYDSDTHEWVNHTTGERGRIAWDHTETRAWLTHPFTSPDQRFHETTATPTRSTR